MKSKTRPRHLLPMLAALLSAPTWAAPTTIDLSAEASRSAANDLARASVFAEASGSTPGELSKRVNSLMAEALRTTRDYGSVKTQNGATHTYPVYAKGGKIEAWRMRSELSLESRDTAALSELLGKLQASLGIASLTMLPAAETRSKAENEAMLDALAAFKARAKLVADALGKPWRIKQLSVSSSSGRPPMPMLRSAAMYATDAAPMPLEAGESQISASVAGQIELAE